MYLDIYINRYNACSIILLTQVDEIVFEIEI